MMIYKKFQILNLFLNPALNSFGGLCYKRSTHEDGANSQFRIKEVQRFIRDCAVKVGCSTENSTRLADLLVQSDCLGVKTHGLNRLDRYLIEVAHGVTDGKAVPTIIKETEAISVIDGNSGLGHIVACFAMSLAIKKAKASGAGMSACFSILPKIIDFNDLQHFTDSSNFGCATLYSQIAVKSGCIGVIFTNSSPAIVPFGAKDAAVGTNPICIAGPASCNDFFNLDISTAAVSRGKIEMKKTTNEPVPIEWAVDSEGKPATKADDILKDARLLPLGSPKFGHLGYGLSVLVDILSSMLSGANISPLIQKVGTFGKKDNIGFSFIVINPEKFNPHFAQYNSEYLNKIRSLHPNSDYGSVTVAGDIERKTYLKTLERGVLDYNKKQLQLCNDIAKNLKVAPLKPKKPV